MSEITNYSFEAPDGTRLALWLEDGSRPPQILLVHGLASNARLWDGVALHLNASGHSTLQLDLRGHGVSDKPSTGYDFATMNADLSAVINEKMNAPVMAIGQSFGGNLVLELAVRFPDLVSSVVCVDGGFINLASQFETWEDCVEALTPPSLTHLTPASLTEAAAELYSGWPPEAIAGQLANLEASEDNSIRRRLPLTHHLSILRAMYDQRPQALAEKCEQPVLIIAADDDMPGKSDQVNAFVKRLPQGRVRWLRGHHDLHAEQPANVADAVEVSLAEGFLR